MGVISIALAIRKLA